MKDERLEKEFDEYFKGLSTPDNITTDAKKYVKPRRSFMPKFLKFASVAASCVLVAAFAIVFSLKGSKNDSPPADEGNAPDGDMSETLSVYYDSELSAVDADAYSLPNNRCFKYLTKLAYTSNANVSDCVSYYSGKELVLFNAQVSILSNLTRYDADVYIEFTQDKVYAPLKDYSEGTSGKYRGAEYCVTETVADNGEPESKLYINYLGVKYYFDITSSDKQAYLKYLEIVVKNF